MALPPLPAGAIDVTQYFVWPTDESVGKRFSQETGLHPAYTGNDVEKAYRRGGASLAMAYMDASGMLYTLHIVQGDFSQTGPHSYREERRYELRPLGISREQERL